MKNVMKTSRRRWKNRPCHYHTNLFCISFTLKWAALKQIWSPGPTSSSKSLPYKTQSITAIKRLFCQCEKSWHVSKSYSIGIKIMNMFHSGATMSHRIETSLYDYSGSKQPLRKTIQNYNPVITILQCPKIFERKEKQIQHNIKQRALQEHFNSNI